MLPSLRKEAWKRLLSFHSCDISGIALHSFPFRVELIRGNVLGRVERQIPEERLQSIGRHKDFAPLLQVWRELNSQNLEIR